MASHRFGSRLYTEVDIYNIAFGHGCDGIIYYSPQDWGGPAVPRKYIVLQPRLPLEVIYLLGYRMGYYYRRSR